MVKKTKEESGEPIDISDLTNIDGIGEGTEKKLKEGGIYTIMSIAASTPGKLADAAGVGESQARKFINLARDLCKMGFETGTDVAKKQDLPDIYIPTNCSNVDNLLGGGLKLGTSLEAFGEFSSGKTNLSHIFAVSTIARYPDSYVVYIDTENTFSAKRIREVCEGFKVDPEKVLSHIKVGKAMSSDHQILLTENVENEIVTNHLNVKLVIIDSLMNHFRAEYIGRATLAVRQQTLNTHLHKLGQMMTNYNFAVYITNQIQSDPGMMFGDPNKAIGGNIVAHFATIRVYMRKAAKGAKKMILVDSPDLPQGEATFNVVNSGIEPVVEKD